MSVVSSWCLDHPRPIHFIKMSRFQLFHACVLFRSNFALHLCLGFLCVAPIKPNRRQKGQTSNKYTNSNPDARNRADTEARRRFIGCVC